MAIGGEMRALAVVAMQIGILAGGGKYVGETQIVVAYPEPLFVKQVLLVSHWGPFQTSKNGVRRRMGRYCWRERDIASQ